MANADLVLALASTATAAVAIAAAAALRGWRDWLDVRRLEIERGRSRPGPRPAIGTRIELADLKERVRRLEAIANGTDG